MAKAYAICRDKQDAPPSRRRPLGSSRPGTDRCVPARRGESVSVNGVAGGDKRGRQAKPEFVIELTHSIRVSARRKLLLDQCARGCRLCADGLGRGEKSLQNLGCFLRPAIDRTVFEKVTKRRVQDGHKPARHRFRNANAKRLNPSPAVKEHIEIKLAQKLRHTAVRVGQDVPVGSNQRHDLFWHTAHNLDLDITKIGIGRAQFSLGVRPFQEIATRMSADNRPFAWRLRGPDRPLVKVDQIEKIMAQELRSSGDDVFELMPHLGADRCEDDGRPEHSLQISFHHLEIILRIAGSVEGRMLDRKEDDLRSEAQRPCRHVRERQRIMREKNVALDCLLARQPRHLMTLKNVEKTFLEPSGTNVGNTEKWKQSR
ncbi:hypothetical protein [Rhizobium phaseoli]|uniref:hypothetical protein n=1 Tax=Rhizobium phaseoli TaxID=396 RepID=UPI003CC96DF0